MTFSAIYNQPVVNYTSSSDVNTEKDINIRRFIIVMGVLVSDFGIDPPWRLLYKCADDHAICVQSPVQWWNKSYGVKRSKNKQEEN